MPFLVQDGGLNVNIHYVGLLGALTGKGNVDIMPIMEIYYDENLPASALQFLKRCYRFVNQEWQHSEREVAGDQGFERRFRESCVANFPDWTISQEREMRLGESLETASGVLHEVDIVAQTSDLVAVAEIKNRPANPPDKNDAIIFFAKLLDYLAFNPTLLLRETLPVFISSTAFDEHGLAACLGLGIHPVAPGLRPLPVLVDSALRMNAEIRKGMLLSDETIDQFEEFCVELNRLSADLDETWLTNRCGYVSENTLVLKAVGGLPTRNLGRQLWRLNGDCTELLAAFRKAVSERGI